MLLMTLEQLMGNNAINTEVPARSPFSSAYFIDLSNALAQSGAANCTNMRRIWKNVVLSVSEAVLSLSERSD